MTKGTHVDLGQAMIVMIEPDKDPERLAEYNRWYEHDHVYSGVVAGPGAFSYSRFVATRELKDLRYPDPSAVAQPLDKGSYLSFFYLLAGQVDEHYAWSFPESARLGEAGADELRPRAGFPVAVRLRGIGQPRGMAGAGRDLARSPLPRRRRPVDRPGRERLTRRPRELAARNPAARIGRRTRKAASRRRWSSRRATFRGCQARERPSATGFSSPASLTSIHATCGVRGLRISESAVAGSGLGSLGSCRAVHSPRSRGRLPTAISSGS